MIATMGETTGYLAIKYMRQQMMADPVGRQILEWDTKWLNDWNDYMIGFYSEQPRINTGTVDLSYLKSLPDGTFGREYVRWLDVNVWLW